MTVNDLIFWYTGAGAWAVIAAVVAIAFVIVAIVALCKAWRTIQMWTVLGYIGHGEIQNMRRAIDSIHFTGEEIEILNRLIRKLPGRLLKQRLLTRLEEDDKRRFDIGDTVIHRIYGRCEVIGRGWYGSEAEGLTRYTLKETNESGKVDWIENVFDCDLDPAQKEQGDL